MSSNIQLASQFLFLHFVRVRIQTNSIYCDHLINIFKPEGYLTFLIFLLQYVLWVNLFICPVELTIAWILLLHSHIIFMFLFHLLIMYRHLITLRFLLCCFYFLTWVLHRWCCIVTSETYVWLCIINSHRWVLLRFISSLWVAK